MSLRESQTEKLNEIKIVGASGYVGRNIARALHGAGHKVVALSRRDPKIENVRWVKFNALNLEDITDAQLSGSTVINCSAVTKDQGSNSEFVVNYRGAANLAEAVEDGKLIHISSSSIYNLTRPSVNVREEEYDYHGYSHMNEYSRTKALAEELLAGKSNNAKQIISLRPHAVYGKDDTTLLPRLISRVRWLKKHTRGAIFLPGGGSVFHSVTHIDNLVEAVKLSLTYRSDEKFTAFNISDSEAVRLDEAVEAYVRRDYPELQTLKFMSLPARSLMRVAERFPQTVSRYELSQVGHDRTYDISKAKSLLGYNPEPFKVL